MATAALATNGNARTARRLTPGNTRFDADHRRELDRRTAQLGRLRTASDEAAWHQGQHYLAIRDRKLYLQDGCSSFKEWIETKHKRARSKVYEKMAFAEHFSLADVRRHGRDMLELLLVYVGLTVAREDDWALDSVVVKVPRDGRIVDVPFRACIPADLEAAIAHQRRLALERALAALEQHQQRVAGELRKALTLPDGKRALGSVAVRPASSGLDEDSEVRLQFRWGDLRSVVERLANELLARRRG